MKKKLTNIKTILLYFPIILTLFLIVGASIRPAGLGIHDYYAIITWIYFFFLPISFILFTLIGTKTVNKIINKTAKELTEEIRETFKNEEELDYELQLTNGL